MKINKDKNYSVSGKVLDIIQNLEYLYNVPNLVVEGNLTIDEMKMIQPQSQMCISGGAGAIKTIPLQVDKIHYLVGQLIATYNSQCWEEL